jgi:hypothetical protein
MQLPKPKVSRLDLLFLFTQPHLFFFLSVIGSDPILEAELLCDMGELACSLGDVLGAEDYLQSALEIANVEKVLVIQITPLLSDLEFVHQCDRSIR